jgi:hypothetical protein
MKTGTPKKHTSRIQCIKKPQQAGPNRRDRTGHLYWPTLLEVIFEGGTGGMDTSMFAVAVTHANTQVIPIRINIKMDEPHSNN